MVFQSLAQRVLKKVQYDTNGGCWLFAGKLTDFGYGVIKLQNKKQIKAHRIIYEHYNGTVRNFVLHKCDVRCCVNPNHLYDGTQADNMKDLSIRYWGKVCTNEKSRP